MHIDTEIVNCNFFIGVNPPSNFSENGVDIINIWIEVSWLEIPRYEISKDPQIDSVVNVSGPLYVSHFFEAMEKDFNTLL